MGLQTLATILLFERLLSSVLILLVLWKQMKLFKKPIVNIADTTISVAVWARRLLFILSLVVLFGNFIPITIDYFTIFSGLEQRAVSPTNIGILYAISNATTSVFFSLLVWGIYKLAEQITIEHQE